MQRRGVHARVHVVGLGLLRMGCLVPVGEGARALVLIPIEALADRDVLHGGEAERGQVRHVENERGHLLLEAEFGRLLQRLDEIAARIGEADDIGARGLRLQQEGREIRRVERMARRAQNLAAGRDHRIGAIALEILAEGIIGRDEVPGLRALAGQRLAERIAEHVGVVGPVNEILRAHRARQHRRTGARADHGLVLLLGDRDDGERDRRIRQVHDHVDALGVVPLARDAGADVGLVLVIGDDRLDLHPKFRRPILNRHVGGDFRADALVAGIGAGQIVHDADLHRLALRGEARGQKAGRCAERGGSCEEMSTIHGALPGLGSFVTSCRRLRNCVTPPTPRRRGGSGAATNARRASPIACLMTVLAFLQFGLRAE